jgi:hypothetical protein
MNFFPTIWHWIEVHTGTVNESGPYYGFWSGFGSDMGEVVLFGAVITMYRKHSCHVHRCWRMARHPVDGTPYVVCRRHHPTFENHPITAEHVAKAHAEAAESATPVKVTSPVKVKPDSDWKVH